MKRIGRKFIYGRNRILYEKICLTCNSIYQTITEHQKYCCFNCYDNTREKSSNWKGGVAKHADGYLLEIMPSHPNAIGGRYVLQHRLVMERHLGRYLYKQEIVHHINEIKSDNRIENLRLYKSRKEHVKFHRSSQFKRTDGKREDYESWLDLEKDVEGLKF